MYNVSMLRYWGTHGLSAKDPKAWISVCTVPCPRQRISIRIMRSRTYEHKWCLVGHAIEAVFKVCKLLSSLCWICFCPHSAGSASSSYARRPHLHQWSPAWLLNIFPPNKTPVEGMGRQMARVFP